MFEKLKKRWEIDSNLQLVIILIVFSITGSLSVLVRNPIFEYFSIDSDTNLFLRIILSILIITPTYQVLLLLVGSLFGQFRFFWNFEKKMLSRFQRKNNKTATKSY
ncbi:DUF6787 family protein [Marinifilum caeruleilacunae]|uniref:Diacylglyceryl transferase n=1 Tax=Marinifilum caeruleilacunae TaxID=2499076 RepID=A0ABX1WTR1_9BACT|nr:DUF6787 family protein [Marinifilum caeruleilacunae]NOU59356.1 diacylglyceryl transferase [Marinifilum caeruleilacunae]